MRRTPTIEEERRHEETSSLSDLNVKPLISLEFVFLERKIKPNDINMLSVKSGFAFESDRLLGCGHRPSRPDDGQRRGRRAECGQYGRPEGLGSGLRPSRTAPSGKAALASNYTVTGGIQTGAIRQPTLLPFAEQQQQALRDAFITDGNLAQLADGLGTTLGAAYEARAHYLDREHFTSVSKAVAEMIAYANSTSGSD